MEKDVILEKISDMLLYNEAETRMSVNNNSENVSQQEMMKELGITQDEIDNIDVDIEVCSLSDWFYVIGLALERSCYFGWKDIYDSSDTGYIKPDIH